MNTTRVIEYVKRQMARGCWNHYEIGRFFNKIANNLYALNQFFLLLPNPVGKELFWLLPKLLWHRFLDYVVAAKTLSRRASLSGPNK